MNLKMVKKGLANPTAVPEYLLRRVRDYRADRRLTFGHKQVTGSRTRPDFSKELFVDVMLLEQGINQFRDVPAERSLEIGCGYGRLTPWIARHSQSHHAIEAEEVLLEDARKRYPDVTFEQTLAQDLPYDDSSFDLIVTWAVLMHVSEEEIPNVVSEIKRVKKDSGVVLAAEKVGSSADVSRVWTREIAEYESLFSPLTLSESTDRKMEQDYWDADHRQTLMVFT